MHFLTIFFIDENLKKLICTRIMCFFFEEGVHNWARRETKNYSNDLNVNALERQYLGASFELHTGPISQVITSLCLITIIAFQIFFLKKVRIHAYFVISSKQLSRNGRVEPSIIVQMIWIVVRWKKEILAHLLSYIVDSQVSWALL